MPKPLSLRAAEAALRALLHPRELKLRASPFPSAFLDNEPDARFFGPSWDEVVAQAVKAREEQIQSHITND